MTGLLALVLGSMLVLEAPGSRMPRWPTEVERIAAPLAAPSARADERRRVETLGQLDRYATSAIADVLVAALSDPSIEIGREALRMCYERGLAACAPRAAQLWATSTDRTLRLFALRVLALHPDESATAVLLEALREPSEDLRAGAASFLGWAEVPPGLRARVREAVIGKLSDVAASVRREAALAIGLMGPGLGALPLSTLLEDPDPVVRAAAAEAIGGLEDPHLVAALLRALDQAPDVKVTRAVLDALARTPGPESEQALLRLLDTPPQSALVDRVALALGRREDPSPALLAALIERLSDPGLSDLALDALRRLGAAATPALRRALQGGLPAAVAATVTDVLSIGRRPGTVPPRWPEIGARAAWIERLDDADPEVRLPALAELAARPPAWLGPWLEAELVAPRSPRRIRDAALIVAFRSTFTPSSATAPLVLGRLITLASDPRARPIDRCIALGALERVAGRGRTEVASAVVALLADPIPRVRGCATAAATVLGPHARQVLLQALWDPAAIVRALAALSALRLPPDPAVQARLVALASLDLDPEVRASARIALVADRAALAPTWTLQPRAQTLELSIATELGVLVLRGEPFDGLALAFAPMAPAPIAPQPTVLQAPPLARR